MFHHFYNLFVTNDVIKVLFEKKKIFFFLNKNICIKDQLEEQSITRASTMKRGASSHLGRTNIVTSSSSHNVSYYVGLPFDKIKD